MYPVFFELPDFVPFLGGQPITSFGVFMLLAGINFVLHYRLLTGRAKEVWRDSELRYFLGVIAVSTLVLFVTVHEEGAHLADSLRHAAFQTVSILTTTGYCTTDFESWATLPLLVLLCLMVLGGMSGSTGGGIKSLRALLGYRFRETKVTWESGLSSPPIS